jgi:hypothetical protein
MTRRQRRHGSLLTLALLVSVLACKKEERIEYPPPAQGAPTQPGPVAQPADAGAPAAPLADAGLQPLDAASEQLLRENVERRAKKEAAGLAPLGDFFGGRVEEGGQIMQQIMMNPGACYGVVAAGSPGVVEVDIQIVAAPLAAVPGLGTLIAVDNSVGQEAAITPCYRNAFPIGFPAQVLVKATRGAGGLGARVYMK